jgi:hypothetical protein
MKTLSAYPKTTPRYPVCRSPLILSAIFLVFAAGTRASTITAEAGSVGLKDKQSKTGKNTWNYNAPGTAGTAAAEISWIAGVDTEDGNNDPSPALTYGPEPYFNQDGTGRTFNAFGKDHPLVFGPKTGSQAINDGSGSSSVSQTTGSDPHMQYKANWQITATGKLGDPKKITNPMWKSHTEAVDPWTITPSDFLGFSGPTFDVFFEAGITSANLSPNGTLGFDVTYQTGAGTIDLLHVTGGIGSVTVDMPAIPGLQIYAITDQTSGADDLAGAPLTAGGIQSLFQSLDDTGVLSSPALFGFLLQDQPIPTQDIGGGAVASLGVDTSVDDHAENTSTTSTPEPAIFALLGSGLAAIALWGRRRTT